MQKVLTPVTAMSDMPVMVSTVTMSTSVAAITHVAITLRCGNIDECELEIDHCSFDVRCYDTLGSYTCELNGGFDDGGSDDGKTCNNINECAETDFCRPNSVYADALGSYVTVKLDS